MEIEKQNDSLEQVAKDMYTYMNGVLNKNWACYLPSDTDAFYIRLQALGIHPSDHFDD